MPTLPSPYKLLLWLSQRKWSVNSLRTTHSFIFSIFLHDIYDFASSHQVIFFLDIIRSCLYIPGLQQWLNKLQELSGKVWRLQMGNHCTLFVFSRCIVCPSNYGFWLLLLLLQHVFYFAGYSIICVLSSSVFIFRVGSQTYLLCLIYWNIYIYKRNT